MGKKNKIGETKNKKEILTQEKKGGKGIYGALAGLIAAAAFVAFVLFSGSTTPFKMVTAEAGTVSIPYNEVNDGKAHYYSYETGRGRVNFFVLKSSDGVVRAAFDACDVCYREKKGYRQEGDYMVCNNCGQRFPSVKVNEIKGGCNPAPIERDVVDGRVVLTTAELENGRGYF